MTDDVSLEQMERLHRNMDMKQWGQMRNGLERDAYHPSLTESVPLGQSIRSAPETTSQPAIQESHQRLIYEPAMTTRHLPVAGEPGPPEWSSLHRRVQNIQSPNFALPQQKVHPRFESHSMSRLFIGIAGACLAISGAVAFGIRFLFHGDFTKTVKMALEIGGVAAFAVGTVLTGIFIFRVRRGAGAHGSSMSRSEATRQPASRAW